MLPYGCCSQDSSTPLGTARPNACLDAVNIACGCPACHQHATARMQEVVVLLTSNLCQACHTACHAVESYFCTVVKTQISNIDPSTVMPDED